MNNEADAEDRGRCKKCCIVMCACFSDFESKVQAVVDDLTLSVGKKKIIRKRFIKEVLYYEKKSKSSTRKYNSCRLVIAIGSMILPTLQTIQGSENVKGWNTELYWTAIGTSLSVMIANTFISMFHLDKRYFAYHLTNEKLKSIGWKYFELSGIFSGKSHEENWTKFWNEIEKAKYLQVSSEFSENNDENNDNAPSMVKQVQDEEKKMKETKRKKRAFRFMREELKKNNNEGLNDDNGSDEEEVSNGESNDLCDFKDTNDSKEKELKNIIIEKN